MKIAGAILLACTLFIACRQKEKKTLNGDAKTSAIKSSDTSQWTDVQWVNENYDFGKVEKGPKVEVSYQVKNTGDKPLVIESVHKTCGCTETTKPEEPIKPGETGTIKAVYDSNQGDGKIQKSITVVYNSKDSPKSLSFTGEVAAVPTKQ